MYLWVYDEYGKEDPKVSIYERKNTQLPKHANSTQLRVRPQHVDIFLILIYSLIDCEIFMPIYDEYRNKKPSKADYRKKTLDVFDHQIQQKLATDVSGVSFDAQ